jgi:hypothetical protein
LSDWRTISFCWSNEYWLLSITSEATMQAIAEILSGQGGLAGVQQLLSSVETQEHLRAALSSLMAHPARLGACRLQRAKFKPHRKITAYYDLALPAPTGDGEVVRPLAVTWTLPTASTTTLLAGEWQPVQADALSRQVAAPFQGLLLSAPEQGLKLELSPLDVRYPHLVRLADPAYVRELLAECHRPCQPAPARDYRVRTIRYRPGQRHVLRYDPIDAHQSGKLRPVFAKLDRDGNQQPLVAIIQQAADWLAGATTGLRALRPLTYVAADQVMLYPWTAGEPLSQQLGKANRNVAAPLHQTGLALRTLHELPTSSLAGLPTHDFASEIKQIVRTCEQIQLLLPRVGATIHALLERAQAHYDRLPQEAPTFVHGDYKADHVLVTPDHLTLIDFDSCALADPAYDIGKFLADLAWWHADGSCVALTEAQGSFLAGYGLKPAHPRLRRALLWAVLIGIKIAAHRIPLFQADWAARTTAMIEQATLALELATNK